MARDQQVNVALREEEKDQWEQHVEENPNAENLSHLIRLSVAKEISGGGGSEKPTVDGDIDALADKLDSLEGLDDSLRRIEGKLQRVDERLAVLEQEEEAGAGFDLRKVVFSALPVADYGEREPAKEPPEKGVTPAKLADETGAPEEKVLAELDRLTSTTSTVVGVVGGEDNERYFWKKE